MARIEYLLFSILLFLCTQSFSQTELDQAVLNRVNDLREQKNLETVISYPHNYEAAKHHSRYLIVRNSKIWPNVFLSHNEDSLKTVKDRLQLYSGQKRQNCSEIIICVRKNFTEFSLVDWDLIAKMIVDGWVSSKKNNKILLSPNYKYVGSCQFFVHPVGIADYQNLEVISTAVFSK
jgi:uncharacterized protein YkwD